MMEIITDGVDLTGLDNLEAAVSVIFIVRGSRQRSADTRVNVAVVPQQTFLCRMEEVSSVIDGRDFAWRTAKDFGLPSVAAGKLVNFGEPIPERRIHSQMAVEMNDRDRAIGLVDTAQQRQGNGMVTTQGDDSWQHLAGLGDALLVCVGVRFAHQDAVVPILNLLNGVCVVITIPSPSA
jgi:hypothetical protein